MSESQSSYGSRLSRLLDMTSAIPRPVARGPVTVDDQVEIDRRRSVPLIYRGALQADFSANVPRVNEPCSLFVWGDNGTGKTHLACALCMEWGGYFLQFDLFQMELRASYNRGAEPTEREIFARYAAWPVLVIDDISGAHVKEHGASALRTLINLRDQKRLVTIVTSFKDLDQLDALDSSVASRLSAYRNVRLIGPDRRMRRERSS